MKKWAPLILVLVLSAFPCMADVDHIGNMLSFSIAADYVPAGFMAKYNEQENFEALLGVEISIPLGFMKRLDEHDRSHYFMVAPAVTMEYGFFSDLLRIRAGVRFGKLETALLGLADYYAGVSGVFMKDFANDVPTGGISFEIGAEVTLLFFSFGYHIQYDVLYIERYNRLGITVTFGLVVK